MTNRSGATSKAATRDLPYVKAMWHYARGIALVARGDLVAARREADAVATLERLADFSSLTAAGIPSNEVLRIALHVVHGRIFQAEQNYSAAIEQFAQAEAKQAKLPYMEPPYWYYPVSQSLGAVLLQAGRLDEAEGAFQRALQHAPNSAWIQYGLLELAKLRGDAASTAKAQAALERRWIGERRLLSLHVL